MTVLFLVFVYVFDAVVNEMSIANRKC